MKKKRTWKSKLTKKQLLHIKETTDGCTLGEFERNREFHKKSREKTGEEPCWICFDIEQRLKGR